MCNPSERQCKSMGYCRLEIDVDLGDRTEIIRVAKDDDPHTVSECFLKAHGLPALLKPKLAALVQEGL